MQLIEIRLFIEINENQTNAGEVVRRIETEIDDAIDGVVKRADLIDITER